MTAAMTDEEPRHNGPSGPDRGRIRRLFGYGLATLGALVLLLCAGGGLFLILSAIGTPDFLFVTLVVIASVGVPVVLGAAMLTWARHLLGP